jgi:hypothetical protein
MDLTSAAVERITLLPLGYDLFIDFGHGRFFFKKGVIRESLKSHVFFVV